jgi:hypothetical protein
MRVYTADGMCYVIKHDKSGCLMLVDDETNRFRNSVLRSGSVAIDVEETENLQENGDQHPDQMRVYGAASSCNGLYDCVLFFSFKILNVNYRTLTDESCSILIRPLLDENDEMMLEDLLNCFKSPISTFY